MSYVNNNYYKKGSWNVVCDVCGVQYKSDEVRKRWDGLIVCERDWEPDHPQKFLRVKSDGHPVPFIRQEPEIDHTQNYVCYLYARSSYAGLAEASCAQAGNVDFPYNLLYELKNGGSV